MLDIFGGIIKKVILIVLGTLAVVGFIMSQVDWKSIQFPWDKKPNAEVEFLSFEQWKRAVDTQGLDYAELRKRYALYTKIMLEPKYPEPRSNSGMTTYTEPTYTNEHFAEFFNKWMGSASFRKTRSLTVVDEINDMFMVKIATYGDFVNQDSLTGHWLYSIKYKERQYNYTFTRKMGKWYFLKMTQ
jgi:hypothetical protein